MKKSTLLILSIAALSSNVMAGDFEGWSAGINLGSTKANSKLVDPAGPFDGYVKKTNTTATIFGQYGQSISENGLLTVGASYDVRSLKTMDDIKQKNHYSVYLAPGYKLDQATLIYGKVGYHAATLQADDGSLSLTTNGVGYGAGVRYKLDKEFFVQAELEKINYSKKTFNTNAEITPHITSLTVGIGYQF